MMVYITSINFNYGEYVDGMQSVTFHFTTTGTAYDLGGELSVTKEEYMENSSDVDAMRQLVKNKIIADLQVN